ncbi:MAG: hypothetical protein ACFCVH_12620 [Alphaproteobacteria bacterium]
MDRINQYQFYQLGQQLKDLSYYNPDTVPSTVAWIVVSAEGALKRLLNGDPIHVKTSKRAAEALYGVVTDIMNNHFSGLDQEGKPTFRYPAESDPPIPWWRFNAWRHSLQIFETVFSAELREAATYAVPQRGIFDTAALIDSAERTFPNELFSYIPDKSKDDWRAAGRCLAFNLLSATGFHVARAVEGTLEKYYQTFSRKSDQTLTGWQAYVNALNKIAEAIDDSSPAPSKRVRAELLQMKDDYRNPLMHPRVNLNEADARIIFDNGESLIIAMASEMKALSESSSGTQSDLFADDAAARTNKAGEAHE